MASTHRAHIIIPDELLREIDALVGPRGRSAFLLDTAREEVRRRKLLRFLENPEPAWKDENHPELRQGSAAWIRKLRSEGEGRLLALRSSRPTSKRSKK